MILTQVSIITISVGLLVMTVHIIVFGIVRDHLQYFHLPPFHMVLILLFMAPHFLAISPGLSSVNLNGKTLYSNKRNYGQYQGSFMRLTMSGFSSLFGCGATLSNRLASLTAPFYCEVKTSNTL